MKKTALLVVAGVIAAVGIVCTPVSMAYGTYEKALAAGKAFDAAHVPQRDATQHAMAAFHACLIQAQPVSTVPPDYVKLGACYDETELAHAPSPSLAAPLIGLNSVLASAQSGKIVPTPQIDRLEAAIWAGFAAEGPATAQFDATVQKLCHSSVDLWGCRKALPQTFVQQGHHWVFEPRSPLLVNATQEALIGIWQLRHPVEMARRRAGEIIAQIKAPEGGAPFAYDAQPWQKDIALQRSQMEARMSQWATQPSQP